MKSETFHRAEQLRKILSYVSREIILHPDQTVREYEVAFNALGRRKDFDATQDNIVRVQFTHLRRKLETYFTNEGKNELLVVTISKGSYTPLFLPAKESETVIEAAVTPEHIEALAHAAPLHEHEAIDQPRWTIGPKLFYILLAFSLAGWIATGWILRGHTIRLPKRSEEAM